MLSEVCNDGERVPVWSVLHCWMISDEGSCSGAAAGKAQPPPLSVFRRSHMAGVSTDGLVSLRYLM